MKGAPRRRPLRRFVRAALPGDRAGMVWLVVAVLAVATTGWGALRGPAVGGFRDSAGMDRYLAAYDEAMENMPEPQRTLDIRTDHGIVRVYRFEGRNDDESPMVLLPGTQSGSPVWADNLPGLLEHRSVYVVDLLGEPGRSVQSRPINDGEDKAAWLHEVMTRLPEPELHVVGLSIGGWTAANLATRRPEKIASLTLVEPVMVFTGLAGEAVIRSIPASLRWFPKSWRDSFSSWTAGGAPVEDDPVARMIEAGMQGYRIAQPAPARIPEERLRELDIPTLVIVAGSSPMHDPEELAANAERVPGAEVRTYPGTSHALNGEEPERLAADIGAFVEGPAG